jgi:hypothetical protein
MSTPGKKQITVWKGNTFKMKVRFKVDADTPFDLTGSEIVMTVVHSNGTLELSSNTSGITLTDPVNGEVDFVMTAEETREMSHIHPYVRYEIERRINGEQTTLLYGRVDLTGGNNVD